MTLFQLINQFAKLAHEDEIAPDTLIDFDLEPETEKVPSLAEFFEEEDAPDTVRQETIVEATAKSFINKYADELAPDTLRSGDSVLAPTVPLNDEQGFGSAEEVSVPKLDGNERAIHDLSPQKQRLLSALDVMFHAGIVTPAYYQKMRKYIYGNGDMTLAFTDLVTAVQDAEKEMRLYEKRLSNAKELLSN